MVLVDVVYDSSCHGSLYLLMVYDLSCHVWYLSHHGSYWWHMIHLVMIYYTVQDGIWFVSSCLTWLLEIYDSSCLGYDIWDFGSPLCWCMPALCCVHVHMSIASSVMSSRSYFVCTSVVVCICCQKSGVANRLLWHFERDYFTNVTKIFLTMFLESMICVGWTTC